MALTGLLMLAREFPRLMQSQAKRLWAPLIATGLPRDIAGQRVTIVGWGPIARSLAAMLEMLGMSVSVVRNSPEPAGQGRKTVTFPEIDTVLTTSDWLVLACPLTDTTRDLIDARRLRCLPRGARLINVARGEVVVEPDLVKALEDNYLAGAYLDVFAYEPLAPDSPLWSLPNVIVTPHTAGHSDGNEARVDQIFLDHLATWVSEATREREPLPGDRTLQ
jgi:phosphoglycerate dehydrogenase-like enzyme